jgi:glycosyltransferase involved in cell wall biosynthesis
VRARFALRRLPRWAAIAASRATDEGPRVYYGHERLPTRDELAYGGAVKFQALHDAFPNSPRDFGVLYLGSSTVPEDAGVLIRLARRRGAVVVWNQNGVAYPGWHGDGWDRTNSPLAHGLHAADHVLFQSAFCKLSSDRYLGERREPWEVLHNPVDTERFVPADEPPERPTLLLGGNQSQPYRLETALRTLALLPEEWQLLVGGAVAAQAEADALVAQLGLERRVDLMGPYTQLEAPALLRRAHLLLHTKYNDPCPTIVLEAMASGLPVVHSASGGTAELVDEGSGVGVPAPLDWERDHPPAPEELRDAVLEAAARRAELGAAARRRAVERFDVRPWLARHRQLFGELAT